MKILLSITLVIFVLSFSKPVLAQSTANNSKPSLFCDGNIVRIRENATDADLAQLGEMRGVTSVRLVTRIGGLHTGKSYSLITEVGLKNLRKLTDLRELDLSGLPITNADLSHISELKKLEIIRLMGSQITDKSLANLKGLTNLRELFLDGNNKITDAGLMHFKQMHYLQSLTSIGEAH